jgi:hypothetical protein
MMPLYPFEESTDLLEVGALPGRARYEDTSPRGLVIQGKGNSEGTLSRHSLGRSEENRKVSNSSTEIQTCQILNKIQE